MHGIFDSCFFLFELSFSRGTDFDQGDSADHLGQPFLEFLPVIIRSRLFDLCSDLLDPCLDIFAFSLSFNDRRVVFVDHDLFGVTQPFHTDVLELHTDIFSDHLSSGEDGDIFQHGFSSVAESRSFNRSAMEGSFKLVDDQCGQSFTFDLFGDDQQRLSHLGHVLQQRQEFSQVADLLLMEKNQRIFEDTFHPVRVSDEIRGQIAPVELHSFNDIHRRLQALSLFHCDDAVFSDFVHGLGDNTADGLIIIGGYRSNLGNHLAADFPAQFFQLLHHLYDSLIDSLLDQIGIAPCCHMLESLRKNTLGQHSGCCRSVSRYIRSLGRHFFHELSAHVLQRFLELDFFRDGHTVFGAGRRTELLIQNNILASRTECFFDHITQNVDTFQKRLSCVFTECNLFCHFFSSFSLFRRFWRGSLLRGRSRAPHLRWSLRSR